MLKNSLLFLLPLLVNCSFLSSDMTETEMALCVSRIQSMYTAWNCPVGTPNCENPNPKGIPNLEQSRQLCTKNIAKGSLKLGVDAVFGAGWFGGELDTTPTPPCKDGKCRIYNGTYSHGEYRAEALECINCEKGEAAVTRNGAPVYKSYTINRDGKLIFRANTKVEDLPVNASKALNNAESILLEELKRAQ